MTSGYDGQYYYRLALDPADLSRTAFGITLDSFFRLQRIGYPLLSWLAAVGQHALVPDAEIAVNLLALAVLAWLGAVIARDAGRHCSWGLLVAGYWGFVFSIARDLPEVVGSCFLVAGLVALRRERPVLGGVLFAGAALTIETTLDVVLAVALVSVVQLLRHRRGPGRRDAAWIVPGVAFTGWQVVCWAATGTLTMRADSGANLSWPFVNALGALADYLGALPSVGSAIWLGEPCRRVGAGEAPRSVVTSGGVPCRAAGANEPAGVWGGTTPAVRGRRDRERAIGAGSSSPPRPPSAPTHDS